MNYQQQRLDPRWQKIRLRVLEYAKFRCQMCGCKHRTLHVHHSYYLPKKMPWQYPTGSLISLCHVCHDIFHKKDVPKPDLIPVVDGEILDSRPINETMTKEEIRARFQKMKDALNGIK